MKKLLCACAVLIMAFCATTAFAADVTGTWGGDIVAPNGDSFHVSFTFKQDGAKLTGTVTGPQGDPIDIAEGIIEGNKLSFTVSFNGMVITHEGVVSGDTIKLTTKSDQGDFPGGGITLTRAK